MTRLLVCGGRDFNDARLLQDMLDHINGKRDVVVLISGGARGADHLGELWAHSRGIHTETYEAEWGEHGRAAGPIRNQRMIDDGKPDLVIAFPGGRGTADMVRRARAAGVEVVEVASV